MKIKKIKWDNHPVLKNLELDHRKEQTAQGQLYKLEGKEEHRQA